jgi:hypothetical protein
MIGIFPTPMAPISWGELIDKITILEIKKIKICSSSALLNINKEIHYLNKILSSNSNVVDVIKGLKEKLYEINLNLWQVEDNIRDKELRQEFDLDFIALARSVYRLNDARAKLKASINLVLNSELVEEKSYKDYL